MRFTLLHVAIFSRLPLFCQNRANGDTKANGHSACRCVKKNLNIKNLFGRAYIEIFNQPDFYAFFRLHHFRQDLTAICGGAVCPVPAGGVARFLFVSHGSLQIPPSIVGFCMLNADVVMLNGDKYSYGGNIWKRIWTAGD